MFETKTNIFQMRLQKLFETKKNKQYSSDEAAKGRADEACGGLLSVTRSPIR